MPVTPRPQFVLRPQRRWRARPGLPRVGDPPCHGAGHAAPEPRAGTPPRHPDRVKRARDSLTALDQMWVADFT